MAREAKNEVKHIRILSVFFHPNPSVSAVGGAEKRFIETLKIFREKGVKITVVEPDQGLLSCSSINCEIRRLSGPFRYSGNAWFGIYVEWILWTLKAWVRCVGIVHSGMYDLILTPNDTLPNLIPAYFAHLASHLPLCVVTHCAELQSRDSDLNFFMVFRAYRKVGYDKLTSLLKTLAFFAVLALLKRSDACIAVSNSTAKVLVKMGLPRNRVHVSGNAVDLSYINSFRYEGDKLHDGVFVGRISKEKGVFCLVEAWRKIVQVRRNAQLLIIGSGPEIDNVIRSVKNHDLEKNVIVKGYCSDKEMYTLMKASKTFVLPSVFEGWGLAVAEALTCGLPVICYDIPALREIFGGCGSVFFIPAGDVDSLASTVLEVLAISETARLAETSTTYVKRFDWKRVARKDLQIVSKLSMIRES